MTRSALTKTTPTAWSSNGTNITDASYTTMSTGDGNGVTFSHDITDVIILLNDSGGTATYTVIAEPVASVTAIGGTITDPDITVANNKTHVLKPIAGMSQTDGDIYIDCDVAGKIIVLDMAAQA